MMQSKELRFVFLFLLLTLVPSWPIEAQEWKDPE